LAFKAALEDPGKFQGFERLRVSSFSKVPPSLRYLSNVQMHSTKWISLQVVNVTMVAILSSSLLVVLEFLLNGGMVIFLLTI